MNASHCSMSRINSSTHSPPLKMNDFCSPFSLKKKVFTVALKYQSDTYSEALCNFIIQDSKCLQLFYSQTRFDCRWFPNSAHNLDIFYCLGPKDHPQFEKSQTLAIKKIKEKNTPFFTNVSSKQKRWQTSLTITNLIHDHQCSGN